MTGYNQTILKRDAQNNVIQDTFYADMTFRGEYAANMLIYKGYARAGSSEDDPVWQIALLTYNGTDLVSITWAQAPNGIGSSQFNFVWTDRAALVYS